MSEKMPIFVKVEEYNEVLGIISEIKSKLDESKNILKHISDLKVQEDREISSWKIGLDDVEKKIKYMDHTLFEPER